MKTIKIMKYTLSCGIFCLLAGCAAGPALDAEVKPSATPEVKPEPVPKPVPCDTSPISDTLPHLLMIKSVVGVGTEKTIDPVTLGNFTFNGEAIDASQLFAADVAKGSSADNTMIREKKIICNIPCVLGSDGKEGKYTFTIAAAGYKTKLVKADGNYSNIAPSHCPKRIEGAVLNVELNPSY